MTAALLADMVLVLHLGFIAYVVFGSALLWRWPGSVWLHLPTALWGAWIEVSGGICPLTPLENRLRRSAGESGYAGSFVERYLLPLVYPDGLTREVQLVLGLGVVLVNLLGYALWLLHRTRQRRQERRLPGFTAAPKARSPEG